MNRFIYLRTGLALVLGFVGLKMITAEFLPFRRVVSLGIIVLILGVTIWLSMLKTKNSAAPEHPK
jgi:tellurite resistance protein TerC